MLNPSSLLEIATCASNLSERTIIVQQLAKRNLQVKCTTQLSPLDTWIVEKIAGKLAAKFIKRDSNQQSLTHFPKIGDIKELLTKYKLYELNLANFSELDRFEFIKVHAKWLNVYQAALATLDLPREDFSDAYWYKNDIYYGKFAKVCEPFLRLLDQTLRSLCNVINVSQQGRYTINPQVLADIQLHLLKRFEISLAWALEADINVYCSKNNIAKTSDSRDAYIAYLEQTFNSEQDYHRFYCKFPVLGRWLAQITNFLCTAGEELIQRLTIDREQISSTFFGGREISQIKSLKLGQSDHHAEGKSVIIVELELIESETATIVYKPRCLKSEAAMQGLLETLNRAKVVEFATYKVLCKEDYGYAEFIPSGKNHVLSKKDIERFYSQLGGYLAIFYILGGGDMHYENILVANGNAFICDCETVLEVLPHNLDKLPNTVFDSVFKTVMLDWPRPKAADRTRSISGYSGGESYESPFSVSKINDSRMSLALAVEQKVGERVEVEPANRIYYNGQLVGPHDYQDCIVSGFNQVYSWFQQNTSFGIQQITKLFAPSSVRFINLGTQTYVKLIAAAQHPKCLADPLEVDLFFSSLIEHPRKWDETYQLAECEVAALWQLDVPLFTAKADDDNELIYNYHHLLPDTLAISPLDNAAKRIHKLSTENQIRQNQYIYTSFSTEEINNQYFIDSAVNYAQQIGWQLCELLQPSSSEAPWKNYEFTGTRKDIVDIRSDLYAGSAGICLFLAYLDWIQPQPEFRQAAERALEYSIKQRDTTMVGVFQGATGLIYLLTHLAQLWNKPTLLDLAAELIDELIPDISQDRYFDILHGVAGIIPVMIVLAEAGYEKALTLATQCAQHLLEYATYENGTLSWPCNRSELAQANLTGFSHGASGIGWALILLGCHIKDNQYITAGRQAFAYEASKFDLAQRDWYDLRTSVMKLSGKLPHFANAWCNGAAGIGLSRIAIWAALGKNDDDLLREAYTALSATLRNFHQLGNDSLCHGKAGNAELLLRVAKLRDEPYLQMEANVQAQAQWRNFEKSRYWICGTGGNDVLPDLMLGLAGIGMHFLRLAYPERIPSPLLLDPPPNIQSQAIGT
ncbi:MAG: type 2 lantipeptide synthetase LanM family protein [Cyanomargarita calcarea GSE-NOS-MK-12-04C]|jgi:type 2 lantibiotic biosynthesis protein LanM|uniref:Type 2 lantipeptide synthetase LanM family protein n=1 Tax=Cyanomargarita calcarea GSE-NOS-MK-12-04C TaxID=2839659 RepID=A0A951QH75_9CYAN|nr:type 2 lantipeptide synthetase LanM family protein [Cyanomargarita calcarea GSE-NOS-MK-12-04C]